MPEEALEQQESKAEAKARKKEEKQKKKEEKRVAKENAAIEAEEQESGGSKLVVAFATLVIIVIWLGILALLIRLDVGGFGSTVLYPILKDVPYVNKILPEVKPEEDTDPAYPYKNLDEAIAQIKTLENQLAEAKKTNKDRSSKVEDLEAQVRKLERYRENAAELERQKQEFYEEVVFANEAPDISEYQKYYEMIEPDNAEVLYKEVVEQEQYDEKVDDFIKTYSSTGMKPKEAAAIFETMTKNLQLVKRILEKMSSADRGDILASMTDKETAAKLTEMLEPSRN